MEEGKGTGWEWGAQYMGEVEGKCKEYGKGRERKVETEYNTHIFDWVFGVSLLSVTRLPLSLKLYFDNMLVLKLLKSLDPKDIFMAKFKLRGSQVLELGSEDTTAFLFLGKSELEVSRCDVMAVL